MRGSNVVRAFQIFHATLAVGLLAMSLMGVRRIFGALDEPGHLHLALVGGLQALGAVLLLVPRAVRVGGVLLLVVLVPGFVAEALHGDWEIDALIYIAGVWFVMAHGAAWGSAGEASRGDAGR